MEARKLLIQQLNSPDENCKRRLEEIKARYPEAFGDTIREPCKLRKFEILLKPGYKYYCFLLLSTFLEFTTGLTCTGRLLTSGCVFIVRVRVGVGCLLI